MSRPPLTTTFHVGQTVYLVGCVGEYRIRRLMLGNAVLEFPTLGRAAGTWPLGQLRTTPEPLHSCDCDAGLAAAAAHRNPATDARAIRSEA